MEKTIDTNNIYEVINAINAVVRSSKNPKPLGNSKYEKAQEITDKMKYAWSSYIEAVALESILSRVNFKESLSPKGQAIYKSLTMTASKKNDYLESFKKLITKQKLGLFDEMNVTSTYYIRYETNEDHEMEYVLHESKDRKNLQSVMNSLTVQGKGMLNLLEKLVGERKFAKETPEEIEARLTELSKKSDTLGYADLQNVLKTDLNMKLDTTKLDAIKLDYDKLTRQTQRIDEVTRIFEKYRNYISPETFLKIVALSEELSKAKSDLIAKQTQITNSFESERNKISEKVFGSEKTNRINAILSMLTRGHNAEGKELSTEQKNILSEELAKMQKEDPEGYKKASNIFASNENARTSALSHEFSEKAQNKLDDSQLSLKEQAEKIRYYNLYVASQGLDRFISMSKFSMLYDKFLKMEQSDSFLLNEIVNYYLAYLDYIDKMKERNEESAYANWEDFVNSMLMENGYVKNEGR